MDLKKDEKRWNKLAERDPLWTILTHPKKIGNQWKLNEFLNTGKEEVEKIVEILQLRKIKIKKSQKVLDFGCGVGRVTQALAAKFNRVYGIDISETMIRLAIQYNRFPNKCSYKVSKEDLSCFKKNTFDMVYTNMVLQHIEPVQTKKYIGEFLRVLKPQGIMIFQLPSSRVKGWYRNYLKRITLVRKLYETIRHPTFPMFCMTKEEVREMIVSKGGKMRDILEEQSGDFVNNFYIVEKEKL